MIPLNSLIVIRNVEQRGRWNVSGASPLRSFAPFALLVLIAAGGPLRAGRVDAQELPFPEPATCAATPARALTCSDGAFGNAQPESFGALTAPDVNIIVRGAARSLNINTLTIAVVDRAGRVLALFRQPGADPANDDLAIGTARTAAFFSHNMAPLSSRTVRFISGVHFPAGVVNTSNAALYGIENTNRGCDFNVRFNEGKCIPRARSLNGSPCNPFEKAGCGTGIVTGKRQPDDGPYPQRPEDPSDPDARPVNAGGIALYRLPLNAAETRSLLATGVVPFRGKVVGAIGVVGAPPDHPEWAEFAAVEGAFAAEISSLIVPLPVYPLPFPEGVFIDGIRLPFLGPTQQLVFNRNGLPTGLEQPAGTELGNDIGLFISGPSNGGCAPNDYLVGPSSSRDLTAGDVQLITQRAVTASRRTRAAIRLPINSYTRMVIAISDLQGNILGLFRMPDATVFSIDVAVAKARNVVYFSGSDGGLRNDIPGIGAGVAVSNRTVGFTSQPLYPPGIDSAVFNRNLDPGPFFESLFVKDLLNVCSQGSQATNANQSGIVFFPGSTPLYRNGKLIGGLGVSGDGVEQDDYVTFLAAGGLPEDRDKISYLPDSKIWADRLFLNKARLPMFKFPRRVGGVRECGGKPCG
ncbi:MAG TPA: heme-binding protein [Thermoanaerobaculia bacterium]|nr:heme-binding protein [Thermoanaerobaculia bacterium]